jgi:hypothetical protein
MGTLGSLAEVNAFPSVSTLEQNWQLTFKEALKGKGVTILGSDDYLESLLEAIKSKSLKRLVELLLSGSREQRVSSERLSKLLSLPLLQKSVEEVDPVVLLLVSSKVLGFNGSAGVVFSAYRLLKSGVEVKPVELRGGSGLVLRLLK